jgi:basic amino acid/polyamine antiporter, APA family
MLETPIPDEGLKRVIGVRSLAVNAVNMTVGAGIFALPAVVALHLGPSGFWAYIICAILLSLIVLCFIEVGSKIVTTGGAYSYVEKAFGPLAGFLTNTIFWLGFAAMSGAAVANVMVDNLAIMVPALSTPVYRIVVLAALFGGLALLNIRGSKESSGFVFVITLVKLLPLLLLVGFGLAHVQVDNLRVTESPSLTSLGEGALILFFAFGGGAESTLSASGEIKDPKRTIPRGILLGVLFIVFIYMAIQGVAQGVLGDTLALQKEAPLAAVAEVIFGPKGVVLMTLAAAVSCFGLISGDQLVTSRMPYAAARDGLLPSVLARIHPRFSTPHYAIILYSFVGFLLAISGGFRQLAILSSAAILLIYVGVIAATIRLRNMKVENTYTNPGGITIPVLALLATGWFLSHLQMNEVVAVSIFLAFFTSVYFLMRFRKK